MEEESKIVEWSDKYSVGIPFIDEQHKKLIEEANALYQGCLTGNDEEVKAYFIQTIKAVIEYTKYHFAAEEKMMENINYPLLDEHRQQHAEFVRDFANEIHRYEKSKMTMCNHFARFLRDWVLSHIAMEDAKYSKYIFKLKKEGELPGTHHLTPVTEPEPELVLCNAF